MAFCTLEVHKLVLLSYLDLLPGLQPSPTLYTPVWVLSLNHNYYLHLLLYDCVSK